MDQNNFFKKAYFSDKHPCQFTKCTLHINSMYHFTYWQLQKCVTWIPVCKQPPHEKSREAWIFGESFPRCLIETEIKHRLQTHFHRKMKVMCLGSIKCTNLSIKLGFISRLYIVKSRKGILFNKMSPTRPVRIQMEIG